MTGRASASARLVAAVVTAGLFLAACAGTPATTGDDGAAANPDTEPAGPETRQVVLDLALPTYDGGEFDPGSVRGKPVILWFWGAF